MDLKFLEVSEKEAAEQRKTKARERLAARGPSAKKIKTGLASLIQTS